MLQGLTAIDFKLNAKKMVTYLKYTYCQVCGIFNYIILYFISKNKPD